MRKWVDVRGHNVKHNVTDNIFNKKDFTEVNIKIIT